MTKNIKRIAHDLMPLSDAVSELSSLISQLLSAIKPHTEFTDDTALKYFNECTKSSKNLTISSGLIKKYIHELNTTADKEGIIKN